MIDLHITCEKADVIEAFLEIAIFLIGQSFDRAGVKSSADEKNIVTHAE